MNKYALVDVKGGLGNQLFQLSFADYLRNEGFKTYLDLSFFGSNHKFPRELEINPTHLGFKSIKLRSNLLFRLNNSVFLEDDTFGFGDLKKYNRFSGYYQNFKYLEYSKLFLKNKLNLNSNNKKENIAAIHIRKTDYKVINQELSDEYYEVAISKLLNINSALKFDIFTDDENLKLNENVFKNINNIHKPILNENAIETLRKMLNYEFYIIANSSLSAIAAFLADYDNKVILFPEPWWRNSSIKLLNIPSNWIAISNL